MFNLALHAVHEFLPDRKNRISRLSDLVLQNAQLIHERRACGLLIFGEILLVNVFAGRIAAHVGPIQGRIVPVQAEHRLLAKCLAGIQIVFQTLRTADDIVPPQRFEVPFQLARKRNQFIMRFGDGPGRSLRRAIPGVLLVVSLKSGFVIGGKPLFHPVFHHGIDLILYLFGPRRRRPAV